MDQNLTIKEYIDGVKDRQAERMRRPGDAEMEFLPIAVGDLPVSGEILWRHIPGNARHPHHIAAVGMLFDNGRQALVYRADYEPMTAVAGISVGSRATLLMDDDSLVAWSPAPRDIELVKYDGPQVHELTREEFWNGARVSGKYEGQPGRSEYTWEVQHGERGVVARVPSENLHIPDDVTPTNAVLAAVHVAAIERALQTHATGQDLTVPDAVLAQYPDLAKRYGVALPDRNGEAAARSAAIEKVIRLTEKQDALSSDIRPTQSDGQASQSVMPTSADLPAETLQLQLEVEAVGDKILDRHIAAEPLTEQERADAIAALEGAMIRASSDNSGHVLFATLDGVDVLAAHDIKHAVSPGNPFTHEQLRQRYEEARQKRSAQLRDDKNAGVAPLEKPMDRLVEWHEVTLAEFAKRAVVTKLQNHGRKWEVELPGGTRGFSDAATPSEAIADSHRQAIANVLWWHAPEHADARAEMQAAGLEGVFTAAMPSASVLADYPDLVRAYDLEYLLKRSPQAEPASQGAVPIANAESADALSLEEQIEAQADQLLGRGNAEEMLTEQERSKAVALLEEGMQTASDGHPKLLRTIGRSVEMLAAHDTRLAPAAENPFKEESWRDLYEKSREYFAELFAPSDLGAARARDAAQTESSGKDDLDLREARQVADELRKYHPSSRALQAINEGRSWLEAAALAKQEGFHAAAAVLEDASARWEEWGAARHAERVLNPADRSVPSTADTLATDADVALLAERAVRSADASSLTEALAHLDAHVRSRIGSGRVLEAQERQSVVGAAEHAVRAQLVKFAGDDPAARAAQRVPSTYQLALLGLARTLAEHDFVHSIDGGFEDPALRRAYDSEKTYLAFAAQKPPAVTSAPQPTTANALAPSFNAPAPAPQMVNQPEVAIEPQTEEADGFAAGTDSSPIPPADLKTIISNLIESISHKDQSDGSVLYLVKDRPAFVDHGQQIVMHEKAREDEEAILAAILLAKEKYGGAFELTGSEAFKRRAIEVMLKYEIDAKLKNPQQDALRRELAKTKADTPKTSDMPEANPQARIGKSANNDQCADATPTTSPAPEDVLQRPLTADLVPVPALEWWSVQRDAIHMWAKTDDELKADLADLGPQPSADLVYWFDKAGKACDPPADADDHLSNINSEQPGFAPGSESELRTRDAMVEGDVSATVMTEKENLMSDNQESKEDGPKLILRGVKKLDNGTFDTTVMLFKGKGNYLQGFVKIGDEKHQVIAHINERKPDPDTGEIKPNFLTLSEAHGNGDDTKWKQLGFGNAVNQRSDGKPVYFDEVLLKVGDDLVKARTTKHVDSDMHQKLGFQEPRQSRPKEEQKAPAEPAKPAPKAAAPAANEVAAGAKKPRRSQRAAA
jgi:hypothetical protein